MYLKPSETLTVETLLYGLLLCSGNDAAVALADHCGGSVARFVGWMNETAQRIGMTGSSFANPNGLDDEQHYSTARDMALLAAYAARNPTFVRLCSTRSVTVGGRTMTNHNKLLQSVEGCIGMKTGYTSETKMVRKLKYIVRQCKYDCPHSQYTVFFNRSHVLI